MVAKGGLIKLKKAMQLSKVTYDEIPLHRISIKYALKLINEYHEIQETESSQI